jgi:hypothetical protein
MDMMTKQQTNNQSALPKRLSPEVAEILHMLKALESQPASATQNIARA